MAAKTDLHKLLHTFATKAELKTVATQSVTADNFKQALVDFQLRMNSNNDKIAVVLEKLLVEIKGYRKDLTELNTTVENQEERLKRLERKLRNSY